MSENGAVQEVYPDEISDTDSVGSSTAGYSGPLAAGKKTGKKRSARFKEESYVEITLDVRGDSIAVQNIHGGDPQDAAILAQAMEGRPSSLAAKLRQVSHELRRITSSSSKRVGKFERSMSGATRALQGLQFLTQNVEAAGGIWPEVERRFEELAIDGCLPRSKFGQCIGLSPRGLSPVLGQLSWLSED